MIEEVRQKLYHLAEEDYKEFNKKLLPGVENILGIRLPAMRKLAKEIAKDDFRVYQRRGRKQDRSLSMRKSCCRDL